VRAVMTEAAEAYVRDVASGAFPDADHSYT
jgi:ketopantoate hydroxymethyltransferase